MTGTWRKKKYVIPVRGVKIYQTKTCAIRSYQCINFNYKKNFLTTIKGEEEKNNFRNLNQVSAQHMNCMQTGELHTNVPYVPHVLTSDGLV